MMKLTLNRVRDRIAVAEGSDSLRLTVDADAMAIHQRIAKALDALKAVSREPENEALAQNAARTFAASLFGDAQAEKLMAFYHHDAGAVIAICTQYLNRRLSGRIVKAQKRAMRR